VTTAEQPEPEGDEQPPQADDKQENDVSADHDPTSAPPGETTTAGE
jgi:hypothetical protein